MDQLIITLGYQIINGNIPVIITIVMIGLVILSYIFYALQFNKTSKDNNEETSLQVENSISLILNTMNELKQSINTSAINQQKEFDTYDKELDSSLADLEKELKRTLDTVKVDILQTLKSLNVENVQAINANTNSSVRSLSTEINNDLVGFRFQKNAIKEDLANNTQEIIKKLSEITNELSKIDNTDTHSIIITTLADIRKSIDILNIINTNIRLHPLKGNSNVSEE